MSAPISKASCTGKFLAIIPSIYSELPILTGENIVGMATLAVKIRERSPLEKALASPVFISVAITLKGIGNLSKSLNPSKFQNNFLKIKYILLVLFKLFGR